MLFADLPLARRLEHAEGCAGREFAKASGGASVEVAGTIAMFAGVDSPVTQTFCLGLFENLTPQSLDALESFFQERGANTMHEVSPFAGVGTLELLCGRNYVPIEISNVLYRGVEMPADENAAHIKARLIVPGEEQLWANISAQGWAGDHPELVDSIRQFGASISASEGSLCFLATAGDEPGAAGFLSIDQGVALFGGSSTIPSLRQQGLHAALLRERMRYAAQQGCDLAMIVTETGSISQRNAERKGFKVAYTRNKWRLASG